MFDKDNEEEEIIAADPEGEINDMSEISDLEEVAGDTVKSLKKKLKASELERKSHLDDLQRARADFLNSKRRLEEQLQSDKERIVDSFINDLLPLIDSFDMANELKKDVESIDTKWEAGIDAIYSQLTSLLKQYNVEEVESLGIAFDPLEHEAVSNVDVKDDKEVGKVISVLQKGYRRGGRIIRPAKVIVGDK